MRWAGRSYPLEAHTAQTLLDDGFANEETPPTHAARIVPVPLKVVGLVQVLGPPDSNGFPTLAALGIWTPGR